jgi:excisionase family DNA binding protein
MSNTSPPTPAVFTSAKKISSIMGVSKPTPFHWFHTGKLPGIQVGSTIRFPIAEVARILRIDPALLQ